MYNDYSPLVWTHFKTPSHVGIWENPGPDVKIGVGGGLESGKIIQLSLRISISKIIEEARFKAQGCVATIASASWLTTVLKEMSVTEALQITGKNISEALALPPEKYHCAMLAQLALQEALKECTS